MARETEHKIVISGKDKTKAAFNSIKSSLGGIKNKVFNVQSAVAGLAGAAGFGALIKSSFSTIDVLAKTSDRLGVATEQLQALQMAGELAGLSQSEMAMSLERMNRRLGDSIGKTNETSKALEKMGLDAEQLIDLDLEQSYGMIADGIANLGTQAEKAAAAQALFGLQGKKMLNLFEGGSAVIEDAKNKIEELGLGISRVDAKRIEEANDSMTTLGMVAESAGNAFAVELAPFIEAAADHMVSLGKETGGFKTIAHDAIGGAINIVGVFADGIHGLEIAWSGVQTAVLGVGTAIANVLALTGNDMLQSQAQAFGSAFTAQAAETRALLDAPLPSAGIEQRLKDIQTGTGADTTSGNGIEIEYFNDNAPQRSVQNKTEVGTSSDNAPRRSVQNPLLPQMSSTILEQRLKGIQNKTEVGTSSDNTPQRSAQNPLLPQMLSTILEQKFKDIQNKTDVGASSGNGAEIEYFNDNTSRRSVQVVAPVSTGIPQPAMAR